MREEETTRMSETGTTLKRIEWVDIAKGVAILLVCLGHRDIPESMSDWIYSFHLPLFFFLAGYTTRFESYPNFRAYAIRKVRVLLVPYFVFGLCVVVFNAGLTRCYYHCGVDPLQLLFDLLVGKVQSIWFIPAFFLVEIISYGLNRLPKGKAPSALALALLGYCLGRRFGATRFFWNFDVALVGLFFFWFARLLRDARINRRLTRGDIFLFGVALIAQTICLAFNAEVNMFHKRYGIFPIFLIEATGGVAATLSVCVWMERIAFLRRVFVFLGRNTIPILAFHKNVGYAILEIVFLRFWGLKYEDNVFSGNIEGFIYTALGVLFCLPIIWFVNRFAPWAVGGRGAREKTNNLQTLEGARS